MAAKFNQIDLETTQMVNFFRRLSLRLLHQARRTWRRRDRFACKVVKYWNRLPLAIVSVQEQHTFKKLLDSYIHIHEAAFIRHH